jgi:hypothetical protein
LAVSCALCIHGFRVQDHLLSIHGKQPEALRREMAKDIINIQNDFEGKTGQGNVIHPCSMSLPLSQGVAPLS